MRAIEAVKPSGGDPVSALSSFAMHGFGSAREAARAIFGLVQELVGLRICVLTRVDLATNTLTVLEALDGVGVGVVSGMVLPADEMPCDYVVRSAQAVRELDLDDHPVFRALPGRARMGLRSYIGVPLRRSDGSVWGTLAAADTQLCETTDAHLQTLVVLARLAVSEFEREEQRDAIAEQAKMLENRLATSEQLEEQRLRAVRLQTVLEAAAAVSHEVNNPLTVLQLRLGRLAKRVASSDAESADDVQVALEAADEINQVTLRLRNVVRPVSTHYLSGQSRMLDLAASANDDERIPAKPAIAGVKPARDSSALRAASPNASANSAAPAARSSPARRPRSR